MRLPRQMVRIYGVHCGYTRKVPKASDLLRCILQQSLDMASTSISIDAQFWLFHFIFNVFRQSMGRRRLRSDFSKMCEDKKVTRIIELRAKLIVDRRQDPKGTDRRRRLEVERRCKHEWRINTPYGLVVVISAGLDPVAPPT